ncbi:family 16 glycoside hydrolase [Planctomicrobium sp. SH664]|uniref:family 16 glycoside hydrolase n=1 Tax=Planctomicrobium sp. SH664 TaxID=3448125 RepID=UPI003F5BC57D
MPHRASLCVLFAGVLSHFCMAFTPLQAETFFNGQSLADWKASRPGEEKYWSVEQGEIVGRSPGLKHNVFLIQQSPIMNFRFTCEVKLSNNAANSGIQFRSETLPDGEMRGFQADIGKGYWGQLYEENGRKTLCPGGAESTVIPGEWTRYEIVAVNSRVQGFLNGQQTFDFVDPLPPHTGHLALQLHSGPAFEIRFRSLQLQPLNPLPDFAAGGSQPGTWPQSLPTTGQKITWQRTELDDLFRSEGCAVSDLDNDGDFDVATGGVWYEQVKNSDGSRSWKQRLILKEAPEFDPKGYSESFLNFADDVDGDGWVDVIVAGYPGKSTDWFRNPGKVENGSLTGEWTRHLMIPETNNESPQYVDLDGDGQRELICAVDKQAFAYAKRGPVPTDPWQIRKISNDNFPEGKRFGHGLGAGDLNNDGHNDLFMPTGWWRGEPGDVSHLWIFHPASFGEPCAQMFAFDFDGDGDQDLVSSSAHKFGIWWHEQLPPEGGVGDSLWKTHLIDQSFSQTHALVLADMNGDGLPDLVTGRRHLAHGGKDPGEDQPPVLFWFELSRQEGRPIWKKHQIDDNSGIGTQFEVVDMNGDGLLDVVASNKHGTFVLEHAAVPPRQVP